MTDNAIRGPTPTTTIVSTLAHGDLLHAGSLVIVATMRNMKVGTCPTTGLCVTIGGTVSPAEPLLAGSVLRAVSTILETITSAKSLETTGITTTKNVGHPLCREVNLALAAAAGITMK